MAITRTAPYGTVTDDSGAGTDGTIANNAWLQGLLNLIDARWSVGISSLTGTQTVINPSEVDVLVFQNATDLTIRSITAPSSPAKDGKRLVLLSGGAGNVFLNHNDTTGTTAANRLYNHITSTATPLASLFGSALYVYQQNFWTLVAHDQGANIAWTPTDASGASVSLTNNGSYYYTQGRRVNISLDVTYTSTANGSAAKLALPITPTSGNSALAVGFCNEGSINALVRTAANIEIVTTTGGTVTNANMSLKGIVLGGGYVGS